VQVTLIDLLVRLHERGSVEVLKRLADDAGQNEQVREQAQRGLRQLS